MSNVRDHRSLLRLGLLATLAAGPALASPPAVPVDMTDGWLRRDWDDCASATELSRDGGAMTLTSDRSAALYWQVPTMTGKPLPIRRDQDWVRECDRPPRNFASEVAEQGRAEGKLIDLGTYRWVSWRWRAEATVPDAKTADRKGKIRSEGDDFAAKLGIAILRKGTDDLREIAYVWTRTIPEETVLYQESRFLWVRQRYHRIVAESGDDGLGRWHTVTRDLLADYRRLFPDEEPGQVVRIYLMADGDATGSRVRTSFADLTFHAAPPDEGSATAARTPAR